MAKSRTKSAQTPNMSVWKKNIDQEVDQIFDQLAAGAHNTDRIGELIPSGTLVRVPVDYLFVTVLPASHS